MSPQWGHRAIGLLYFIKIRKTIFYLQKLEITQCPNPVVPTDEHHLGGRFGRRLVDVEDGDAKRGGRRERARAFENLRVTGDRVVVG